MRIREYMPARFTPARFDSRSESGRLQGKQAGECRKCVN